MIILKQFSHHIYASQWGRFSGRSLNTGPDLPDTKHQW